MSEVSDLECCLVGDTVFVQEHSNYYALVIANDRKSKVLSLKSIPNEESINELFLIHNYQHITKYSFPQVKRLKCTIPKDIGSE